MGTILFVACLLLLGFAFGLVQTQGDKISICYALSEWGEPNGRFRVIGTNQWPQWRNGASDRS